jgi:hypothetical protein
MFSEMLTSCSLILVNALSIWSVVAVSASEVEALRLVVPSPAAPAFPLPIHPAIPAETRERPSPRSDFRCFAAAATAAVCEIWALWLRGRPEYDRTSWLGATSSVGEG